jgi:hypothetical protein
MKCCSPTGRRNHGRPLKSLLDTWDQNGSTNGPTPWQIYDDVYYRLGVIFELILAQGISSPKSCLSVNVDSIVIGLQIHVTVYLKM